MTARYAYHTSNVHNNKYKQQQENDAVQHSTLGKKCHAQFSEFLHEKRKTNNMKHEHKLYV